MIDSLADALERVVLADEIPARHRIISALSALEDGGRYFIPVSEFQIALPVLADSLPHLIRRTEAIANGFGLVAAYDVYKDGFHFVRPAPENE